DGADVDGGRGGANVLSAVGGAIAIIEREGHAARQDGRTLRIVGIGDVVRQRLYGSRGRIGAVEGDDQVAAVGPAGERADGVAVEQDGVAAAERDAAAGENRKLVFGLAIDGEADRQRAAVEVGRIDVRHGRNRRNRGGGVAVGVTQRGAGAGAAGVEIHHGRVVHGIDRDGNGAGRVGDAVVAGEGQRIAAVEVQIALVGQRRERRVDGGERAGNGDRG